MLDSDQTEETQNEEYYPEQESPYQEDYPDEEVKEESEEVEEWDSQESEESESVPAKKSRYVEIKDPQVRARVDQLTREKHEAIRAKEELERKLQQYEKEPEAPKEVPIPTADPVTDSELYVAQLKQREQYIRDQAKYETDSHARQQQKQAAEQARQEALQATYKQNIERLKVNQDVLAKAADVCEKFGIGRNPDLVEYLMEDDDGPAIVAYLGSNPTELAEISTMKPTKAISYIERAIRAKAMKKPVSKAPPPPTKVNGSRQVTKTNAPGWTIE